MAQKLHKNRRPLHAYQPRLVESWSKIVKLPIPTCFERRGSTRRRMKATAVCQTAVAFILRRARKRLLACPAISGWLGFWVPTILARSWKPILATAQAEARWQIMCALAI